MIALLKKEINEFFSSIVAYLVITVFHILLSLFLWILPVNTNILNSAYASLDGLFYIAPWLFMFLLSAITMRSFAEEQRTGTIEILLTQPLTELQVILAKYFAAIFLLILSILPTVIFFYTIYVLAIPKGNVDIGGITGSYIGLLFLSSGFVSIGIFASSLSKNQIVSFVISVLISFFVYIGFDYLSNLPVLNSFSAVLLQFSINTHYTSMSRGVIDTRDLLYFISLSIFFLMLCKTRLESRKW